VPAPLRLATSTLYHNKSALGAFYRRMKGRLAATAHKLACLIYRILCVGTEYVDRGEDYYERQYQFKTLKDRPDCPVRFGSYEDAET
jgi:transposase